MQTKPLSTGDKEFRDAFARSKRLIIVVFVLSALVNLLLLTGPMYMMQVYDRVLGSGSFETLVALTLVITFLFFMTGFFDHVRGRILARVGAQFQANMDERIFQAHIDRATKNSANPGKDPLKSAEAIQRFLGSPVSLAFFDLPWAPFFLAIAFMFHPLLGALSVLSAVILIGIAFLNRATTAGPMKHSGQATGLAERAATQIVRNAELVQALGMRKSAFARWIQTRRIALEENIKFSDLSGLFTISTKTMRQYLQSLMLGLGAYLVLTGGMTSGGMIAGSILLGRALAPIELLLGQWQLFVQARDGRKELIALLSEESAPKQQTALNRPKAVLRAENLTLVSPGRKEPVLYNVSFQVSPGQVLGIIGPSGCGKTSLARAITGTWVPHSGTLRLDGATLDQYDPDVLGSYLGYLPQQVTLFEGTIAENIARLATDVDSASVIKAAEKADAHSIILEQADGYDTPLSAGSGTLSGGQIQRIGLARAMFGDPEILILDEPNSNLDSEGTMALNKALATMKAEDKAVIIIAHRPAALEQCDLLLVLGNGTVQAFGPKDEIMKAITKPKKDTPEHLFEKKSA